MTFINDMLKDTIELFISCTVFKESHSIFYSLQITCGSRLIYFNSNTAKIQIISYAVHLYDQQMCSKCHQISHIHS